MKIHSFSRILAFPFIIVAGVILYFLFFMDEGSYGIYLIPLAVILASIYAFQPKIDFWWHMKYPPQLPSAIKKLVYNASLFFQDLEEDERQKFMDRLGVFMNHKAFYLMRKEKEAMPEDMKALIACNAITLTYDQEKYLFGKFDYFIAYQHPFPTPNKRFLHSVEINNEDGVMLFNADQLMQSMIIKNGAFNIGLYAFGETFLQMNPLSDLAQADDPDPKLLPEKGNYSFEMITQQIGYKEVYFKAILLCLFFEEPELVKERYPEIYKACKSTFSSRGRSLS